MTRLRWTQSKTANAIYTPSILCGNKYVVIVIFLNKLTYHIEVTGDGEVLKEGHANTLVSLKKKAKLAVQELGASFYQELRQRGKTEIYGNS